VRAVTERQNKTLLQMSGHEGSNEIKVSSETRFYGTERDGERAKFQTKSIL